MKKIMVAFLVLTVASISIYFTLKTSQASPMNVKIGFDFDKSIKELDPRKVNTITDATILRNLYGSLFEIDTDGEIKTDLVESFSWEDDSLALKLRKDTSASDGLPINAEDVIISLKRLMLEGKNLHGDLKEILCPNFKLETIDDDCPGLAVKQDIIYLKPSSLILRKSLIPLLASVDYRIVPVRSLNASYTEIIDFSITTGPYFLSNEFLDGRFTLQANKYHYVYSADMPQKAIGVPIKGKNVASMLLSGEIDVVPTTTPLTANDLTELNSKMEVNVAKTHMLRIKAIFFGMAALSDFSARERFYIANILKQRYKNLQFPFEEPTSQFFQNFGQGFLNPKQTMQIESLRNNTEKDLPLKRKFSVAASRANIKNWGTFFEENPQIEPKFLKTHAAELPLNERPDLYSGMTDIAFNNNIVSLSYNITQGFFGIFDDAAKKWMRNFLSTESKSLQLNQINQLHFKALNECYIFPLANSPYILVSNKIWKPKLNKFLAATPIWMMRKN